MSIHRDPVFIPSRNKLASGKLHADVLGDFWSETGVGPFAPVFVNRRLTFDFDEWTEPFPLIHDCFRGSETEFDAILGGIKAARLPYCSNVRGPVDSKAETEHGGRIVHGNVPDGHQWGMLTVSYARQA